MALHPVIMAGGSGTRFWPLSRKSRPKQFLPLASDLPLITDTANRLKGLASSKDVWVVCGKVHAPQVKKLVKGIKADHVLVEPTARNTAPAIALAAAHVYAKDPDGVLVVLPSDHHIANPKAFRDVLAQAADLAQDGSIVTVGIKPRSPETGYGYIRVGEQLPSSEARKVAAFVEKPNLETAKGYLASGDYLWNGGIFVFRAEDMLAAIDKHMPEMTQGLTAIRKAIGKRNYQKVLQKEFPKLPSQSIDYGVMEKASNIAVVPGDFGWSDVGSFAAIPEVRKSDDHGNVLSGKGALVIDCEGSIVLAKDKPIAVVGMKDVVVVDAGDAFLVVPKDKSQDVRKAVDALKARKLEKFL
ncbi:MAG: mannose-1-phosphate guanylyltransferase [Myxococcaceae bacterium]